MSGWDESMQFLLCDVEDKPQLLRAVRQQAESLQLCPNLRYRLHLAIVKTIRWSMSLHASDPLKPQLSSG